VFSRAFDFDVGSWSVHHLVKRATGTGLNLKGRALLD
jgi:hypothetical protein